MTKVKHTRDRNSNTTNVWCKQGEPRSNSESLALIDTLLRGLDTVKNLPSFLKDLFNIVIIIIVVILQASFECLMYQANEDPFHQSLISPSRHMARGLGTRVSSYFTGEAVGAQRG